MLVKPCKRRSIPLSGHTHHASPIDHPAKLQAPSGYSRAKEKILGDGRARILSHTSRRGRSGVNVSPSSSVDTKSAASSSNTRSNGIRHDGRMGDYSIHPDKLASAAEQRRGFIIAASADIDISDHVAQVSQIGLYPGAFAWVLGFFGWRLTFSPQ